MSVVLEFTIAPEEFRLGRVLSGPPRMQFELERLVPTGRMTMPFVWVTGEGHSAFAESVRTDPAVAELLVLDTLDSSALYRIEWTDSPTDLVEVLGDADASILQARGDENWVFRVRFDSHDLLSQFHDDILDRGIPLQINRTYPLSETTDRGYRFDLTLEQRQALLLALQRGYFATPREVSLDELAENLGITRQALSDRIRRGNEKVLRGVLLSSVTDSDGDQ